MPYKAPQSCIGIIRDVMILVDRHATDGINCRIDFPDVIWLPLMSEFNNENRFRCSHWQKLHDILYIIILIVIKISEIHGFKLISM